tara:strand:- start:482 stop:937 length:456 start_codon:yes stop_codon:yes gene_type:complete
MTNSPIRNNKLLQEAYEAGYNRALNEQMSGGWPSLGPDGGSSYNPNPNAQLSRPSKHSTGNRNPKSPKPLPTGKAYMENLYGPMWQWIMSLLSQIMGPDWFNQFQNIIHDGSWTWPGWTPNGNGGYNIEFGGGYWQVQFVDGSWQFSFAQP